MGNPLLETVPQTDCSYKFVKNCKLCRCAIHFIIGTLPVIIDPDHIKIVEHPEVLQKLRQVYPTYNFDVCKECFEDCQAALKNLK